MALKTSGTKELNRAVPAVYIILRDGEKILWSLCQNTGHEDGNWQIPSGEVEEAELPKEALLRYAKEKLGIRVEPYDVFLAHVMYREKADETGDRVDFFFEIRRFSGRLVNRSPQKCKKLKGMSLSELPPKVTPHILYALECIQKRQRFAQLSAEFFKTKGRYHL